MNNTTQKELLSICQKQRVLFLENDFTLNHAVGNFFKWCIDNKIEYNALFNLQKLSTDYVLEQVQWFDVIAFQTQWVDDNARELKTKIASMKESKKIIECYIHEPTWFYKPNGVVHDVFVLDCYKKAIEDWKLKKLRLNKAIWEK